MHRPWFDANTGEFLLDQYVTEMPTFQAAMEDHAITGDEMHAQLVRTGELFKQLEPLLSAEAHGLATEALCQLAVLHSLDRLRSNLP